MPKKSRRHQGPDIAARDVLVPSLYANKIGERLISPGVLSRSGRESTMFNWIGLAIRDDRNVNRFPRVPEIHFSDSFTLSRKLLVTFSVLCLDFFFWQFWV